MKILVVDDDCDQLSLRCSILSLNGFKAFPAENLKSAVEVAKREQPSCAIVDLRLPTEALGLETIRRLKKLNPALHLILLTGSNTTPLAAKTGYGLVDEIVTKGSPSHELLGKLKALASQVKS